MSPETTSSTLPISQAVPSPLRVSDASVVVDRSIAQDELRLIARVLNGEHGLFHSLVSRCERQMYFIAFSILNNSADAEDAVQEAVLKAFRALAGFRCQARFSTWIIQITINEAKAMMRKRRNHRLQSLDTGACSDCESGNTVIDVPDARELAIDKLLREEASEALSNALKTLPPKYQAVVKLRDIEGFSTEQTAELLGVTQANVKTRLSRGRLRLKKTITRHMGLVRPCTLATS